MTRALGMLCAALALCLTFALPQTAHADDDGSTLRIARVTPSQLDPATDAELTVTGSYTNDTGSTLHQVRVRMSTPAAPADDLRSLSDSMGKAPGAADQTPLGPPLLLRSGRPLPPGGTVTFRLEAPVAALRPDNIATVLRLELSGAQGPRAQSNVIADAEAILPHTGQPLSAVTYTVIAVDHPLSPAEPATEQARAAVSTALEHGLGTDLADALTARRLILVEPTMVATVAALAESEEHPEARRFLLLLATAEQHGLLRRLPPGNPPLSRLPEAWLDKLEAWSDAAVPAPLADAPLAAIVQGTETVDASVDELYVHPEGPYAFRFAPDAAPSLLGALDPDPTDVPTPDDGTWTAVAASGERLLEAAALRESLTTIGDIPATDIRPLLLAATGSAVPDQATGQEFLRSTPEGGFDPNKISFSAAQSFIMGERVSEFPTTISNQTALPVRVRVHFRSDNPLRLDVPDTEFVTVGPGESQTLLIRPEASANGVTTVHGRLQAPDGTDVGRTVPIDITATEFGRVGWLIICLSGIVVLGGTVWRIRTVQRERSKETSESGQ